jgi:hypothetical protein
MPQPDAPVEHAANTDVKPFVERRRPGRVHYTSPNLIALLRGKRIRDEEDTATGPDRGSADATRSPRVRSWGAILPVLAIAAWAFIGMLAWLVIRLL